MDSTIVSVHNDQNTFQVEKIPNQPPKLQEAPDFSHRLQPPLNIQMPTLEAAPSDSIVAKRRDLDYFPKKTKNGEPKSINDSCILERKEQKRSKQQIHWMNEFKKKQKEELERIKMGDQYPSVLPPKSNRPRMKAVSSKVYQISNMAFVVSKDERVFKCVSTWCNHSSREATTFLNHLQSHHHNDKTINSFSFCKLCNMKTEAKSLEEEFKHLMTHYPYDDMSVTEESTLQDDNFNKIDFDLALNNISNEMCSDEAQRYQEIEIKLMQMFKCSQSNQRIKILQVETLPSFEGFSMFHGSDLMDEATTKIGENLKLENSIKLKSDCLNPVQNNFETNEKLTEQMKLESNESFSLSVERSYTRKAVGEETPHFTSHSSDNNLPCKNRNSSLNSASFEVFQLENAEKIQSKSEDLLKDNQDQDEGYNDEIKSEADDNVVFSKSATKPATAPETDDSEHFELEQNRISSAEISASVEQSSKIQHKQNADFQLEVPTTIETKHLQHFNSHSVENERKMPNKLRRSSSDGPQTAAIKKFKQSTSLLNGSSKFDQGRESKLEAKILGRNFIENLLLEEKSATTRVNAKRRDFAINFEASTSKMSATIPTDELINSPSLNHTRKHSQHRLELCLPQELMPWMDKKYLRQNQKYKICYLKMLNKNSLIALYKCMCLQCSFTTNDVELFLNHLGQHKTTAPYKEDFIFYCPYCNFKSKDTRPLAHHIHDIHSKDVFQCSNCFYRSREKETCYLHTRKSHKDQKCKIFQCEKTEMSQREKLILSERLKRKRSSFVAPIRCQCKWTLIFFLFC